MKLEGKKQLIYECVRLGMDLYEATLLAECSDEQIELLNNDEIFQKRVLYNEHIKEKELLEMHDEAIRMAIEKGDTKGIQWRLEKIKPAKYAKTTYSNINADVKTESTRSYIDMSEDERCRLRDELLVVLKSDIEE